jgi:hypothetical protein
MYVSYLVTTIYVKSIRKDVDKCTCCKIIFCIKYKRNKSNKLKDPNVKTSDNEKRSRMYMFTT